MTMTPTYSVGDIVKAKPHGERARLCRVTVVEPNAITVATRVCVTRSRGGRPIPHPQALSIRTVAVGDVTPATLAQKTMVEEFEESDAYRVLRAQMAPSTRRGRR